MGISLKPRHLKRYRDIARLFLKYGRSDLVRSAGLEDALGEDSAHGPDRSGVDSDRAGENGGSAEELASDLEELGPTFIKLGQLLSTRADLLPLPYLEALARLQDKVEPFSYEDVERTVQAELGVRISKAFSDFEREPMAAASLGQVHRAALRDGRPVAVKIQRPGIREGIADDLVLPGRRGRGTDDGREHREARPGAEKAPSTVAAADPCVDRMSNPTASTRSAEGHPNARRTACRRRFRSLLMSCSGWP